MNAHRESILAAEQSNLSMNHALARFSDALQARDCAAQEKHRLEATAAFESYLDNLMEAYNR